MNPARFEFPLARLPLLAREHVYRTMEAFDRVTSTLSNKRVKKEIKGLRLHIRNMSIGISDTISFCPEPWNHGRYSIRFDDPDQFMESGATVEGSIGDPKIEDEHGVKRTWDLPYLNGIGWINHFIEIFDVTDISLELFEGCHTLAVANVLQCFRAMYIWKFQIFEDYDIPINYLQEMLEAFPAKLYTFYQNPFENKASLHNFLSKKCTGVIFGETIPLDLPDIQLMSCTVAHIHYPTFTDLEVNVFLRVWMSGWNTPLKCLTIHFDRNRLSEDYNATMLRGVEHTLSAEERTIQISCIAEKEISDGYDLGRSDGMKASLYAMEQITEDDDEVFIDMVFVVWP